MGQRWYEMLMQWYFDIRHAHYIFLRVGLFFKRYLVFLHKTKKIQLINPTLVQQVMLSHYIGSSHNGAFYLSSYYKNKYL